jgi:hypothetical protein
MKMKLLRHPFLSGDTNWMIFNVLIIKWGYVMNLVLRMTIKRDKKIDKQFVKRANDHLSNDEKCEKL